MPRSFYQATRLLLTSLLLAGASACFNQNAADFTDNDGDGFAVEFGDCNDNLANVNPDATEVCDNIDNNCDGVVDEGFDLDGDGFTSCQLPVADCNDNDAAVHPGALEVADGIDNDCNGQIDDQFTDDDGDGFCEDPNTCNDGSLPGDCDDSQAVVAPTAIEFQGDGVDNNCNGQIDEAFVPCDGGNLSNNNANDFAKAIELCVGEVQSASFIGNIAPSRAIVSSFGNDPFAEALNVPVNGAKMIHFSTGQANTGAHDQGTSGDGAFAGGDGVAQCIASAHPDPKGAPANGCGEADPAQVCDLTGVDLQIKVPANAQSFTFDFDFFSSEYATFRCSQFDDTFVAFLTSDEFPNGENISFDAQGDVISVNNGFFEICKDDLNNVNGGPPNDCSIDNDFSALSGTGYDVNGGVDSTSAGATRKLTTTVGVTPNEIIDLKFQIFDEGDDILDSSVIIDNFTWQVTPAVGAITID